MRNTVRFTSSAFNTTEEKDYFINPTCFGDDLGAWLKSRLEEHGYAVDGPGQEDWGWYLECAADRERALVCIGFIGDDRVDWQIIIDPRRSLLDRLRGREGAILPRLVQDLHAVLTTAPETQVVEWAAMDKRGQERDIGGEPETGRKVHAMS
jgi:hypothetical protein